MKPENDKLTLLQLLQSIFAALIGVQSETKLNEAFEKITTGQIIFCAVVLLVSFIATAITIVQLVLAAYT